MSAVGEVTSRYPHKPIAIKQTEFIKLAFVEHSTPLCVTNFKTSFNKLLKRPDSFRAFFMIVF